MSPQYALWLTLQWLMRETEGLCSIEPEVIYDLVLEVISFLYILFIRSKSCPALTAGQGGGDNTGVELLKSRSLAAILEAGYSNISNNSECSHFATIFRYCTSYSNYVREIFPSAFSLWGNWIARIVKEITGRTSIRFQVCSSSKSAIFFPFNTMPSLFSTIAMINDLNYDEFYFTHCFGNSCCLSIEEIRILSNYSAVNFNKLVLGKNHNLQNLLLFNITLR